MKDPANDDLFSTDPGRPARTTPPGRSAPGVPEAGSGCCRSSPSPARPRRPPTPAGPGRCAGSPARRSGCCPRTRSSTAWWRWPATAGWATTRTRPTAGRSTWSAGSPRSGSGLLALLALTGLLAATRCRRVRAGLLVSIAGTVLMLPVRRAGRADPGLRRHRAELVLVGATCYSVGLVPHRLGGGPVRGVRVRRRGDADDRRPAARPRRRADRLAADLRRDLRAGRRHRHRLPLRPPGARRPSPGTPPPPASPPTGPPAPRSAPPARTLRPAPSRLAGCREVTDSRLAGWPEAAFAAILASMPSPRSPLSRLFTVLLAGLLAGLVLAVAALPGQPARAGSPPRRPPAPTWSCPTRCAPRPQPSAPTSTPTTARR